MRKKIYLQARKWNLLVVVESRGFREKKRLSNRKRGSGGEFEVEGD
jgi:hypothetical protein